MIAAFVDSWVPFQDAYVAGLLMMAVLALVGVLVVARDQIFIGAAVSQASMLGIAVGILISDHVLAGTWSEEGAEALHSVCGGIVAVLGALLTVGRVGSRETREAITGWVFLVGGSVSVLAVAHSPHGLAEVHRLLASTIIGARPLDVYLSAAALAASLVLVVRRRDALVLFVTDHG